MTMTHSFLYSRYDLLQHLDYGEKNEERITTPSVHDNNLQNSVRRTQSGIRVSCWRFSSQENTKERAIGREVKSIAYSKTNHC